MAKMWVTVNVDLLQTNYSRSRAFRVSLRWSMSIGLPLRQWGCVQSQLSHASITASITHE